MTESIESTSRSILFCHICGDVARGMNYNVITCMPCETFFRRQILAGKKKLCCSFDGHCNVSQQTRKLCSACRLKKCLALGMDPQLIHSISQSQSVSMDIHRRSTTKREQTWLAQPKPIDLLREDRSTLTCDEWNLLSNIVHAYDVGNVIIRAKQIMKQQVSLPTKIRFKVSHTLELIGSFYSAIQPFIECCPYFHILPLDTRRFLIQHNLPGVGSFNSTFLSRETNIYIEPRYRVLFSLIYGSDIVASSDRFIERLEQNGTLIKILLMILAFSSNYSIVLSDSLRDTMVTDTSGINLIRFQNILVTILWKYLIYQYGFIEAIHRFDYLIRACLQMLVLMNENLSRKHWNMVDEIVDQTASSLTVND